jgi:hypothetical protein
MGRGLKRKDILFLLLLTFFGLLLQGYHPGAEDSETYLPGIEKTLHPNLFPTGTEYFQLHAHLTLFPQLIANSVRLTHLPLAWILFLWQIASIFLFLLACRILVAKLFSDTRAIWGGVALVATLLTLPVAGTALYIMDQYINPRNVTAFAVVLGVVYVLEKRYWRASLFLIFATAIHPFMTAFAISYCVLLGWMAKSRHRREREDSELLVPAAAGTGGRNFLHQLVILRPFLRLKDLAFRSQTAGPRSTRLRLAQGRLSTSSGSPLRPDGVYPERSRRARDDKSFSGTTISVCLLLPLLSLGAAPESYDAVAVSHAYQYLLQWRWYEILGAVAPLAILWGFRAIGRRNQQRNLELVCGSLTIYGAAYLCLGVLFSSSSAFESVARLQPMRSLYLLYILMILIGGGFLAQYALKNRPLRWLALFVPLAAGMCWAQYALFPASAHVEWPGATPKNQWVQAFQWIRVNTPQNAVFAIDPEYMNVRGEDSNGFRAIAERSQLADAVKDAGVVEMFPEIADSWQRQVRAQTGLRNFQPPDFDRLKQEYGVTWVVLQQPINLELDCQYSNGAVNVCRIP